MNGPAMQPWRPEPNPVIRRRVGKTGEEAAELLKIIQRIIIQGIDGVDPATGKPNIQALQEELADVLAQATLCIEMFGFSKDEIQARMAVKIQQMAEWEALVQDTPTTEAEIDAMLSPDETGSARDFVDGAAVVTLVEVRRRHRAADAAPHLAHRAA